MTLFNFVFTSETLSFIEFCTNIIWGLNHFENKYNVAKILNKSKKKLGIVTIWSRIEE